ncbi:MAG: phosphatidylinositol-3-phosphatase [Actinomycetota bacterium]|nr:phosphatidylinositol-3-phosphatase [Actinomycetota bacterium]
MAPNAEPGVHVQTPKLDHIAIIVLENEEYDQIIGSPSMPYLNGLAKGYAQADQMFGISRPSLPNYLALISGETHGIASDCTDCFLDAPNLVDQLEEAGVSWKAYIEDMPAPCYTTDAGGYAVRHNPFIYFDSVRDDPGRCSSVVPLDELTRDERAGELPRFIWISPNLCHSMHDCAQEEGDAWLESVVEPLDTAMGDRSIVIITFDEGATTDGCCTNAAGGHIATVVAGSAARRSFVADDYLSLYSVLRTVEESFGLPLLGQAECDCTLSLGGLIERP